MPSVRRRESNVVLSAERSVMRQFLVIGNCLDELGQQRGAGDDAGAQDVLVRAVVEAADRAQPIETRRAGVASPTDVGAAAGARGAQGEAELAGDADGVLLQ